MYLLQIAIPLNFDFTLIKSKSTHIKLILIVAVILSSCQREASCEEAAESIRSDSCNIIISTRSNNEYHFLLQGLNAKTGDETEFKRVNYTWAYWFIDKIDKGDTVVKKNRELVFYIHKKNKVLKFPFECKGKIYE